MQQTRLSRRWLIKIVIFFVASAGLGLWGLYDATLAYPARGKAHAEYMEYQYLLAMGQAGLPVLPLKDPEAAYKTLREDHDKAEAQRAQAESQGQELAKKRFEAALVMEQWLLSLKTVGQLDLEHARIEDPITRFSELSAKWQSRDQPKPLSGFDLPLQWGFVFIGFGLAAYLLLLVVRVNATKYRFDPEELRLTFPGGASITPGDIEDIDKRKWDKFLVQIKSGGKWRKLDLLRYEPLEQWFETMEKQTSFYEAPDEPEEGPEQTAPADESAEAEKV
ncbi:MAG: hypothetical protein H6814_00670 [Phycisphaeraceae bacterium]|nr:hypothetical protein [Phycisphaeraceae bacterium]